LAPSSPDPPGPERGSHRVFRGGGWDNYPGFCRSADRYSSHSPTIRTDFAGFRVVRVIDSAQGTGRAAQSKPAGDEPLRRLIELSERELERARALHEQGTVPASEVRDAQRALLEAKLRADQAAGRVADVVTRLEELLAIEKLELEYAERLVETGVVPLTSRDEAEKQVLEVQVRLETARRRAAATQPDVEPAEAERS
jgi:hypothetical protein